MMKLEAERCIPSPGRHLCGLAWDGHALWHSDADTSSLYQISPSSGKVTREVSCPEVRTGLCYEGGFLWQVAGHPKRIIRVDHSDGSVSDEIALGSNSERVCGLLVDGETYWIGPEQEAWIEQYERASGERRARYGPVPSGDGLILIGDLLWYSSYRATALSAVDIRAEEEVARFELPGAPTDLCFDGERFWFNNFPARAICAIGVPRV